MANKTAWFSCSALFNDTHFCLSPPPRRWDVGGGVFFSVIRGHILDPPPPPPCARTRADDVAVVSGAWRLSGPSRQASFHDALFLGVSSRLRSLAVYNCGSGVRLVDRFHQESSRPIPSTWYYYKK